jgi:hypothetical protein
MKEAVVAIMAKQVTLKKAMETELEAKAKANELSLKTAEVEMERWAASVKEAAKSDVVTTSF